MIITLIRHAQTDGNRSGALASNPNEQLSSLGEEQADRLANYLSRFKFSQIWTSPLPRALNTAAPTCKLLEKEYKVFPFLSEGQFNLDPSAPIIDPVYLDNGHPIPNEPVGMFRGRVNIFIGEIGKLDDKESILVISHGHYLREFLNMYLGATRYVRWPIENCNETIIEVKDDIFIRHVNKKII